jgi:protein involved in polysaccharide export with SLBB domain
MGGMFGKVVLSLFALALAAIPAAAGEISRAPVPLTPHYSVQTPPDRETPSPPTAAPAAKVDAAPLNRPAEKPEAGPANNKAVAENQADETVRVTAIRPSEDESYRLGVGDKLHITVFGETDLSGNFEIDSQGYVRLPLIGQIPAAGQTSYGLENRIGNTLVRGGYLLGPKVNVEVTGYRPFYILGEVTKPGEYPYVNAMNALNAIALAGGFTDRAVTSSLYVRHQDDPREHEVALDPSTRIRPGDVVRVERSTYWAIMTVLAPLFSPFAAVAYLLK